MKVYLVVEDDWESHVVLHASLDKKWAEDKARILDAPLALKRGSLTVREISVEEHELEQ